MTGFWEGKKVLVTGGAGFIGSHLVENLVELGAKVRVPHRETTVLESLDEVRHEVELLTADLTDPDSCAQAVKGQEIVVHMAALVGGIEYNMKHPATIFQANMIPFTNTLQAAQQEGVERFVAVSSACVYPRHCTVPTPESEGTRDEPEPTNAGYGWAKRMEEFLAQSYSKEFGMKIAIPRPYNAYGPRDNFDPESSHVIPALIRRLLVEGENPLKVWGSGNQTRSFLYATDFARGVLEVGEKAATGEPVNVGSSEEITLKELVQNLIEVSGTNAGVAFDTSKPEGQPRRACDTTRLQQLTGFQPEVSLKEGLARTVEWFRSKVQQVAT